MEGGLPVRDELEGDRGNDFGAYYFLYVVGEDVPPHDEWLASRAKG